MLIEKKIKRDLALTVMYTINMTMTTKEIMITKEINMVLHRRILPLQAPSGPARWPQGAREAAKARKTFTYRTKTRSVMHHPHDNSGQTVPDYNEQRKCVKTFQR